MAQLKSGARKDQTTGKEGGRAGRILGKFKKTWRKDGREDKTVYQRVMRQPLPGTAVLDKVSGT